MKRHDPNESSAVYLLTSDDKYAVCGTNLSPNQLLCRKFLATFFLMEETFDQVPGNEKGQVSPGYADTGRNLETSDSDIP